MRQVLCVAGPPEVNGSVLQGKALTTIEMGQIIQARSEGHSTKAIGNMIGRSRSAVRHFLERYNKTWDTGRRTGSGRKRKTTAYQDSQIVKQVMYDRSITSRQI